MTPGLITPGQIQAAAELLGLPLTTVESVELVPLVTMNVEFGELLLDATATDLLPSDDPRWFDHE